MTRTDPDWPQVTQKWPQKTQNYPGWPEITQNLPRMTSNRPGLTTISKKPTLITHPKPTPNIQVQNFTLSIDNEKLNLDIWRHIFGYAIFRSESKSLKFSTIYPKWKETTFPLRWEGIGMGLSLHVTHHHTWHCHKVVVESRNKK